LFNPNPFGVKKLPLLITIGIVLLAAGGYFLYHQYFFKKQITPWDLVPEETVFVYEANDCPECVQKMQQTSVWAILRKAAFYDKPVDSLRVLFDFLDTHPKGQLISAHITRKDDFDFVFYTPIHQTKAKDTMLEFWKKLKTSAREYNAVKINELNLGKQTFSWAELDGVWVGSFTPFLLEDVIRTYTSGDASSFKNEIASVYQLPRIKNDAGNLYVHIKNFGHWLTSFALESPEVIAHFGQSSIMDIKSTDENIVLNGFSMDSASTGYILSVFNNQTPVPFTIKNLVSNRSILFSNYGISDGASFGKSLSDYSKNKRPALRDSILKINASLGVDLDKLYSNLGKEVGVSYVESKSEGLSKIMLVETKDLNVWMSTLNKVAEKTSIDTIFFERFSDYEIREMPVPSLPEKLFWPLVSGFKTCYYTALGKTMLLAENIDDLKSFLDDIDKEETWGKSVAQNKFLETTLLEANLSLYINTPLAWSILSDRLHPRWQHFIRDNQPVLKSLQMGAIQLSHLNNSYYTNITWNYAQKAEQPTGKKSKSGKLVTNFTEGIHKLFVVRNHATRSDDVLIQDSTRAISLISSEGKVLWKLPLDNFITGDVTQVDFFNNGKLQLFFATSGTLHVIDRLGKYVSPYPLKIKEKEIEFTSVIDYDHSKKYRFLVTSKNGKLWMYDKEGNNLDGWKPKSVEESLFAAPQHHRIRGKDYILAVRDDGVAYMINRRGENLKKFPLTLDARPVGDYYLENGNTPGTTYFVVASRDGFRIKFDLEGKIQSRETLIKTQIDARFSLIKEKNDKSYLIARQEPKQLTLFNEGLKEILVSETVGNSNADIQYYNFGSGKIFITITDQSQDLTFVYDEKGTLLTTLPIESAQVIVRSASNERPVLYSILEKTLTQEQL